MKKGMITKVVRVRTVGPVYEIRLYKTTETLLKDKYLSLFDLIGVVELTKEALHNSELLISSVKSQYNKLTEVKQLLGP